MGHVRNTDAQSHKQTQKILSKLRTNCTRSAGKISFFLMTQYLDSIQHSEYMPYALQAYYYTDLGKSAVLDLAVQQQSLHEPPPVPALRQTAP